MSTEKAFTISDKLHQMAAEKWASKPHILCDVMRDAVRHKVVTKDALAEAFGCNPAHLDSAFRNVKPARLGANLRKLGFGTND